MKWLGWHYRCQRRVVLGSLVCRHRRYLEAHLQCTVFTHSLSLFSETQEVYDAITITVYALVTVLRLQRSRCLYKSSLYIIIHMKPTNHNQADKRQRNEMILTPRASEVVWCDTPFNLQPQWLLWPIRQRPETHNLTPLTVAFFVCWLKLNPIAISQWLSTFNIHQPS